MMRPCKTMVIAASAVALSACAGRPAYVEEPHHFSRDAHGQRIACYSTDVATEYECVPVYRRGTYDPWWPHWQVGFYHGWPYSYWQPYPYVYPHPHRHWKHKHRR